MAQVRCFAIKGFGLILVLEETMQKNTTNNANGTAISGWEDEGGAGTFDDRDEELPESGHTEARKRLIRVTSQTFAGSTVIRTSTKQPRNAGRGRPAMISKRRFAPRDRKES
jgi:hypothetical protein